MPTDADRHQHDKLPFPLQEVKKFHLTISLQNFLRQGYSSKTLKEDQNHISFNHQQ
jgi:hypothetical protein